MTLSHGGRFHAILATSSIPEAIQYYKLFKAADSGLRVTALFDPNDDNKGNGIIKEEAIVEILEDYNTCYGTAFPLSAYARFKRMLPAGWRTRNRIRPLRTSRIRRWIC